MFRHCATTLGVLCFLFHGLTSVSAAPSYRVTDLGTLGGSWSHARFINASGQVAGMANTADGVSHLFLYDAGGMHNLEPIGGHTSTLYGMNDSGQIVGILTTGSGQNHAFLYSDGAIHDLGTLGGIASYARGINASGQVVGWCDTADGSNRAFLYDHGGMQELSPIRPGEAVSAWAINDSGQIVGCSGLSAFVYSGGAYQELPRSSSNDSITAEAINASGQIAGAWASATQTGGYCHGFLYSEGTMHDLGTLGGTYSEAYGLNANGQVWGRSETSAGAYRGFVWSEGTMHGITLGETETNWIGYDTSAVSGMNSKGQAVGWATTASSERHAFLYYDGITSDLNDLIDPSSGLQIEDAASINDNGWIAATGISPTGQSHACLLIPIPEPSTLLLVITGLIGLSACAWLRESKQGRCLPSVLKFVRRSPVRRGSAITGCVTASTPGICVGNALRGRLGGAMRRFVHVLLLEHVVPEISELGETRELRVVMAKILASIGWI